MTRPSRGSTLAVVGVLVLVIAVGVFMLQQAMRQRYLEAHRFTSGEVAMRLAESGLNIFFENVWKGIRRPGTPFYQALVEAAPEELAGFSLEVENPLLTRAVSHFGGDATLAVRVELRDFQGFYPPGDMRGVEPDLREKFGDLVVSAEATYRGVPRVMRAIRRAKVVAVTAPVVSKFTLFVRQRGEQELNCLAYDRLRPNGALRYRGEEARPLVVFHHPEEFPTVANDTFHPMRELFVDLAPDSGGLVYLGGPEPWYVNLVHGSGAGPFEELFHLRRARMMAEPAAGAAPGAGYEAALWFGFYDGVLRSRPFARGGPPQPVSRPTGEPVPDATSALHLFGDIFNVSPTLVLGPVFRSYVYAPILEGLSYPYLGAAGFAASPPPPRLAGGYERYRQAMVRVEHESYNRSFDYILTNAESMDAKGLVSDGGATDFLPAAQLVPARLTRVGPTRPGDQHFLYPTPGQAALGAVHLWRGDPVAREDIFRGSLADLDGTLMAALLEAKAVAAVDRPADFFARWIRDGRIAAPGVVLIRSGNLEIGNQFVGKGCMVVVNGNITVTGPILQTEAGQPITLVSLRGDIKVDTPQTVQAALVALAGKITFRPGQVHVLGSLAAHELDLASLVRGKEPKWLVYNPDLDPTEPDTYRGHLRVFLEDRTALEMGAR